MLHTQHFCLNLIPHRLGALKRTALYLSLLKEHPQQARSKEQKMQHVTKTSTICFSSSKPGHQSDASFGTHRQIDAIQE